MKRIFALMIFCLLLLCACAPVSPVIKSTTTVTETPNSETTEAASQSTSESTPEPTTESTTEPTPEPPATAPNNLFDDAYNLFFSEAFPEGYTVYGARFDCANPDKDESARYALYLTAAGERRDITRYIAMLMGITDEATISGYVEVMMRDGYMQIDGTYAGEPAFAQIKQTGAAYDFDQCTEVDGCRIELSVTVRADRFDLYNEFILENYNRAMLGELSERLGDETIRTDLLCIYVNAERPENTEVYVVHAVNDANALEAEFAAKLSPSWHDVQKSSMGFSYGRIEVKYSFDERSNLVNVILKPNDNTTPASAFIKSDFSLTGFGFNYAKQDGLYILNNDQEKIRIEISRPDFGAPKTDWSILFLYETNGYVVGIWYLEAEQRFRIQADKAGAAAKYHYDPIKRTFGDEWPDAETVKLFFTSAFGAQDGDFHEAAMQKFTNTLQQQFGMSWQELCALPVS